MRRHDAGAVRHGDGARAGAALVVLGGLPGTGKTTVARALARRLGAVHVRIDSIEQALRDAGFAGEMGPLGYAAGYAVAADQLALGLVVVADSVNPIEVTRSGWRDVASLAGAPVLEVELACSDQAEHRRRLAQRRNDIDGLRLPTWADVLARTYHPWAADLSLDTAGLDLQQIAVLVDEALDRRRALLS